jgi:enoyl-CoA hydratase
MDVDQVRARRIKAFAAYDTIEQIGKPCIALVEGPAIGSGGEIAMACDFIVATEMASFRTPEALWGTVGATQRLPRTVGKRLAKDMAYTGRVLSANEALQVGLISRIVPSGTAVDTIQQIAHDIASAPVLTMHLTRECIDRGVETSPSGALAIELMAIDKLLQTGDWKQSISGFGDGARQRAINDTDHA